MTATIVTNISQLVTNDPTLGDESILGIINDAALVVENGVVTWVGRAADAPEADSVLNAQGNCVIPGFVDSHTHAVFAGDRSAEFAARMTGKPYDGGGIAVTMNATRSASYDELHACTAKLVAEIRRQGTTTVEIKSGYGLNVEHETRMLKIAADFTEETTFMGGHVVPPGADRDEYLQLLTGEMVEACAPHAKWVDVFCEPASAHAFDGDESRAILTAGINAGLLPRVHAGQLAAGPGIQLAVELQAASVDHCTFFADGDLDALVAAAPTDTKPGTVATLLPGVEFSTRSPFPNARAMWDAGVAVAIATDVNPGSCYSSSMPLMVAMAVRDMHLTPEEALWAATAGGALALRRRDIGALTIGKKAHLAILDAPNHLHIAYRPGVPIVSTMMDDFTAIG